MIRILRLDGSGDLSEAFEIRKKVFIEEQQVPITDEFDGFDSLAVHYLAYYDQVPCGTARWRQEPKGIKLERFSVLPEFRNKGIGGKLVEVALKDIVILFPHSRIYLHAQIDVVGLYEKYGFQKVGEVFMECDILHQTMEIIQ